MRRVSDAVASFVERPIYLWTTISLFGAFVYLAVLVRMMSAEPYDTWGGLVIAPVLVAVSVPLLVRFSRNNDDEAMTGILILGLLAKLGGAMARYFVVFSVYGGNDSVAYHEWGAKLAPLIRGGNFAPTIPDRLIGTGFIEVLTGWVYAVTGPTIVGGYLVFSLFGFWGLYLFYRAFRLAFPQGDSKRYALILFFLPSLLFWSSSIGKEAWMTLWLGATAYGAARLLTYRRGGLPVVLLGVLGLIMVRPHVALVAFLALFAGYIIRPARRPSITNPLAKVGGIVILLLVGFVVLSQVQNFFGVDKLDTSAVDTVLEQTTTQSTQGGSEFQVEQVSGPLGFANAAIAVVFRPWPYEASNAMSGIASLEGVFILGLALTSMRRFAVFPRLLVRVPYIMFCTVFSIGFIFAFASVGNFGILVRQRVQLYPFLFVLLALPPATEKLARLRERRSSAADLEAGRSARLSERNPAGRMNDDRSAPKIVCVAGARPNFMKIKPVVDALERRGADVLIVHTGQHYDAAMSDAFFSDLGLREPDHHLHAGSGSHAEQTAKVMVAFEALVEQLAPDAVVVAGDVNSTLACGLVTAKSPAMLAHVEAGLRSGDWSMPEEVNRVAVDHVSDLLLAPSPDAVVNLEREGLADRVVLVGNVMVDSLLSNVERARGGSTLDRLGLERGSYGVVTLHRPSNVDDDETFGRLMGALAVIAATVPLVFPAHPRAQDRITAFGDVPGLSVVPALGYLDFLALQDGARIVLTDSGGVQEETTVLGVPCLTLRLSTERPITVTHGTNRVVGTDPDAIVVAAAEVIANPPAARCPELWDGAAGVRIADAIVAKLSGPAGARL